MAAAQERILVVESDPEVSDLIARQVLRPLGYRVKVVGTASEAIQQAMLFSPHLVLTGLKLPDLSGKDLLVALSSQGLKTPTIMIAEEGMETDIIQSFRLGATDYLRSPIREAELVSVVERALKQTRARREREQLARQLRATNEELQRRVREMTTVFAIGKAVTSITDQSTLFDRIVEGAVYLTEAQRGWMLVRESQASTFTLCGYRNLPKSLQSRLNQPWDDGISSLVALSGESLAIHGKPLKRFPIARLGNAALVTPVKVHNEAIATLVVLRNEPKPFNASDQMKLEAIADYASISLANARLFRALEARARSLQKAMEQAQRSERSKDMLLQKLSQELREPLTAAKDYVDMLLDKRLGRLSNKQQNALLVTQENLQRLLDTLDNLPALGKKAAAANLHLATINLNELIHQRVSHFEHIAEQTSLALATELPDDPIIAHADPQQINQVIDSLLTNAIRLSPHGGNITVRLERTADNLAHVMVKDTGKGIKPEELEHIFDSLSPDAPPPSDEANELGMRLSFLKDIVVAHGGTMWAESEPGKGSTFHFTLMPPQ